MNDKKKIGLSADGNYLTIKIGFFGYLTYQCEPACDGLVWIYANKKEKIGLATIEGNILIEPTFGQVEPFLNGFAKVNNGYWYDYYSWREYSTGKWGVINKLGELIIPMEYNSIQIDKDSTFLVSKGSSDERTGRLNVNGELIIKNPDGKYILACKKYDWQEDFNEKGYSKVYYNGHSGYINTKSQLIVNSLENNTSSKLIPEVFDWGYYGTENTFIGIKDGKEGVFTYDGVEIFFASNKKIEHIGFGLYSVKDNEGKFYIVNERGKRTNDISFDKIYLFGQTNNESNLRIVPSQIDDALYTIVKKDNLYGTINRLGELVMPIKYEKLCCINRNVFYSNGQYLDIFGQRVAISEDTIVQIPDDYYSVELLDNGLILVRQEDLFGCINKKGNIIIPIKYNKLSYSNNLFVATRIDENTRKREIGILNILNQVVIPFKGTDTYYEMKIENGLILYRKGKYWGAFTHYGKLICEPKYSYINPITEYIIKVGINETVYSSIVTYYGLININGEEILPIDLHNPIHYISDKPDNGLITYYTRYKVGVLDTAGCELIKPIYKEIYTFIDGYAIVAKTSYYTEDDGYEREKMIYGVIDSNFKEIIPCIFHHIEYEKESGFFKTDVGYKSIDGRYIAELDGEKIFIDPKYDYCQEFHNGCAIAKQTIQSEYIDKITYGIININSEDILPPIYQRIKLLDNGLYKVKKENLYGLADTSGHIIVPNKFYFIGNFEDSLAITIQVKKDESGKEFHLYGFIDDKGNEVLSTEYEFLGIRSEGKMVMMKNNVWMLFDILTLQIKIMTNINYLGECKEGLCRFNIGGNFELSTVKINGGKWGFIDIHGKIIISPQYESVKSFSEGIAAIKNNGKWGFINTSGIILVPCEYDKVESVFINGRGKLVKDGKIFVFEKNGSLIATYDKQREYNNYYESYYDDTPNVYENTYYNDNLDMDQQSIEFWNNL